MLQLLIGILCVCVCQVSSDGTGSTMHTDHSDNAIQCKNFTSTSADIPPSVGDPNLEGRRDICERRKHTCIQCGSEFNTRSHLWRHVKAEHNNRRFSCPQCPCTYASKFGLNEHVNLIHEKLSRYRCETCGKGFMVRSRYLDHIATHAGVQRHACPICHMYFTHKGSLKRHVLCGHPNEAAASNAR